VEQVEQVEMEVLVHFQVRVDLLEEAGLLAPTGKME
jgi:hypothetical protein